MTVTGQSSLEKVSQVKLHYKTIGTLIPDSVGIVVMTRRWLNWGVGPEIELALWVFTSQEWSWWETSNGTQPKKGHWLISHPDSHLSLPGDFINHLSRSPIDLFAGNELTQVKKQVETVRFPPCLIIGCSYVFVVSSELAQKLQMEGSDQGAVILFGKQRFVGQRQPGFLNCLENVVQTGGYRDLTMVHDNHRLYGQGRAVHGRLASFCLRHSGNGHKVYPHDTIPWNYAEEYVKSTI